MGFTESLRNNILNHVFRNEPYTAPTTVYAALFTSSGEVDGDGYVRQPITFGAPNNGVIKNDTEIKFPIAASDWGNITSASVFDSETGGNRLADGNPLSEKNVRENDQFSIPVGNYTIEVR